MADKTGGILATIKTAESNIRGTDDDTLKTISDQIDGIGGMTDKEKALLGMSMPAINEWFLDKATGEPPNTDTWTAVEDDADCYADIVITGGVCYGRVVSESDSNDAIIHSRDKKFFALNGGITSIFFEAYCKTINLATAYAGWGLQEYDIADPNCSSFFNSHNESAGLYQNGAGLINFVTTDGTAAEQTALAAYISDNTWFTLKIEITATYAKCYIDGTLRATHSTRVPSNVWYAAFAASKGSANANVYMQKVQVWGE